ncbi:MAG: hypothetical protein V3U16_03210 [Candidatus Neomarinimicrobiota bacterium]
MSLKVFHIFFITVAVLFAIGFGVWSLYPTFQHGNNTTFLWLGIGSFGVAVVLVLYGLKVFQKLLRL